MDNNLPARPDTVAVSAEKPGSPAAVVARLWRYWTLNKTIPRRPPETPEAVSAEKLGSGQPPLFLWYYVIGVSVVSLVILFILFLKIPQVPESRNRPLSGEIADQIPQAEKERFEAIRSLFVMTMGMTLFCGALGGCLFDMRGLIKHESEKDFDMAYYSSYILRPFAGSLSGFIVFLVLVGGLFSMEVQPPNNSAGEMDWIILRRQLPFMAFATLAGYASHVFMMKLKDIAEVIFSIPERMNPVTKPAAK